MISVREAVEIISPHHTGKADDERGTEKQSDEDALAEGKFEFEDYGDGDHDREEVGDDVDDSLAQEMRLLINTLLGYQRQSPVGCDGSGNPQHHFGDERGNGRFTCIGKSQRRQRRHRQQSSAPSQQR